MDPDAALAEARAAAAEYEALPNGADEEVAATLIGSALGSYQALDDWLTKGGFLPADWRSRHEKVRARAREVLIDKYGVDPETINGRP